MGTSKQVLKHANKHINTMNRPGIRAAQIKKEKNTVNDKFPWVITKTGTLMRTTKRVRGKNVYHLDIVVKWPHKF